MVKKRSIEGIIISAADPPTTTTTTSTTTTATATAPAAASSTTATTTATANSPPLTNGNVKNGNRNGNVNGSGNGDRNRRNLEGKPQEIKFDTIPTMTGITSTSGSSPMEIDGDGASTQQQQQQPQQHQPPRATLQTILSRPSRFGNETGPLPCGEFAPTPTAIGTNGNGTDEYPPPHPLLSKAKVLVIGAGGLGCEILKDLAMSGIRDVHVVDLDSIDVTNLNRQFLFRQKDVGASKAVTAAAFINERCPWMRVVAHHGKIQDMEISFYRQFDCIISGLDNVEARRWLNATVVGLVEFDDDGDMDPETIIPIIDGGTEAFSGQARFILPRITSCFECTIDAFPPQTTFPLCTIAETPRRPEHCIAYASILQWPKEFPDKKLDKDSPDDMDWVYRKAKERADKYNIPGVTYMATMGVVKNIIPAVASTNAIIAAACVNECIKYVTYCSQNLNSYMMYMGAQGIHSHTFAYEQKEDCPVCTATVRKVRVAKCKTLNEFIQDHLRDGALRLQSPSIVSASGTTLYMHKPPALEKATRPNLDKQLSSLVADGEEMTITDPVLQSINLTVSVHFE